MKTESDSLEEGIDAFSNMRYVDAFQILLPLAEKGVAEAQCIIGSIYQTGLGAPINGIKAVEWYLKAVEQGHALACHNLGTIYEVGMPGVPSDLEQAKFFQNRAAELGFRMQFSSH